ncbi:hypothetical protein H7J71_25185 [Mycolicibacterium peregrinum]|uniref:hypothetical protein n=1 Tax=Mycolicibacterium peregrinum TaxID=43304 RepID=UPI0006D7EC6D|nr:hypothetical protein [Mycolicibacterium peregrinum]MCV7205303.1 hypothetical protein [Mycolicibacterium peregrinum]ORW54801.1 hypothetical protein AWC21_23955 [Mycolicibacterium peregrinum]
MAAETVTVTPLFGNDDDGNPVPAGTPVVLTPIAIAPGNTTRQFGEGGDLDAAEFTVFLKLADEAKIADDYQIEVRGKTCLARVRVWRSPRTGRGGIEVLCRSATGKAA